MSDTQSPSAFRTGPVRAVVRAGSSDTAYIRVGSGECVLLMIADLDSPLALNLMESLGARFRVIAPINRPSTNDFAGWLAAFLDGLGVSTANLVSDKDLAASSVAYCLLDARTSLDFDVGRFESEATQSLAALRAGKPGATKLGSDSK